LTCGVTLSKERKGKMEQESQSEKRTKGMGRRKGKRDCPDDYSGFGLENNRGPGGTPMFLIWRVGEKLYAGMGFRTKEW